MFKKDINHGGASTSAGASGGGPAHNHVLNSLNPQMFTSQIPVPSSSTNSNLKRRSSLSNNMGLTDMINKSIVKNNLSSKYNNLDNSRKKFRTTVSGADYSNSINDKNIMGNSQLSQRHSMIPYSTNANVNSNPTPNIANRDPRPLRDKNFQNAIQQEIYDYLIQNKFDIEVNYPITIKSLKQPTQKGFIYMFKWLYSRLDPGYQFTKSIEQEVYQLLRTLQYPYLETINKSQISAVGGNSWHKFLGMLHWLVKINIKLDRSLNRVDQSLLNQNTQDVTILNYPVQNQEDQDKKQDKYEVMIEQLCINYITDCYKNYLKGNENFKPIKDELYQEFVKLENIFQADIKNLDNLNEKFSIKCNELAKNFEQLKLSREKFNALQNDLIKFQNYVNIMENKSIEWPIKLDKMKSESVTKHSEIEQIGADIEKLNETLSNRNISIDEIENKNQEKENLTKSLDSNSDKMDKLVSSIKTLKIELEGIYKALLDTLRQYNLSLDNLINERSRLDHKINRPLFVIELPKNLSINGDMSITNETLFDNNFTIGSTIKANINSLNNEIIERIREIEKNNGELEHQLISLKEEVMDKNRTIEKIELQLSEVNSEYELNKQESDSKLLSQEIEIEKIERKINDSNRITKEKLSEAEQLIKSTKLKHEESQLEIDRQRASLNKKVIEIIEFSSNFKINIQNKIDSTETLVIDEINNLKL
ncbi:hypothetical protein Kpol_489p8 [Vanderwaltozyma polyspora DSM 70294]|uniref:Kinetochore protein NDC80 n=1 Tax=Vanderwaltozyma polyspora (strain ATCC 22028 / DSM 70294 / BCRC 21397 / CBS 2163 / NBRC 10782 / NRRL Y-8283 / UCD 57-17) TaxID=436907 RepID=A7TQ22_VANPO|nr:uncharacterized protein Kpol_489p8 [Vanderwaltozyma polyspora DSM 70294]EDO15627.1 hypothetical protein Kpol_489p8 [Vanderwaltozyma polyspora DSM 70294]